MGRIYPEGGVGEGGGGRGWGRWVGEVGRIYPEGRVGEGGGGGGEFFTPGGGGLLVGRWGRFLIRGVGCGGGEGFLSWVGLVPRLGGGGGSGNSR